MTSNNEITHTMDDYWDARKWRALRSGIRNSKTLMNDGAYSKGDPISTLKRKFCRGLIMAEFFLDAIHAIVEETGEGDHRTAWHEAFNAYSDWHAEQVAARDRREARMAKRRY